MSLYDHPLWRKPQHHHDLEEADEHVHWTELFYDLIHVVAILLLGNYLSDHLNVSGFVIFAGAFIALWYAWGELSIFNSMYVATDLWHRLVMAIMVCTIMFMAASVPAIHAQGWLYFALAFAANRLMLAALYFRAGYNGDSGCPMCLEQVRNFTVFGLLFAGTAFLPKPYAYWAFAAVMLLTQVVYMVPRISVLRFSRFEPRMTHMAERFGLLTLIVLGEGFFKLVLTLSEIGIYNVAPDVLLNFVFGGVAIFMMCWLYFDFVGNCTPKDGELATLVIWWLSHLALMLCGVVVCVSLAAEVKTRYWEPYPLKYAAIGCFGLAGYIAMLWALRHVFEDRVDSEFGRSDVRLIGIGLAIGTFFVARHVPSWAGKLMWSSALLSQIVIPLCISWRKFRHAPSTD